MNTKEHSAGVIIFHLKEDKPQYLLLHYPNGHWDYVKGNREKNETPQQTTLRECSEETGLKHISFLPGFEETIHFYFKRGKELVEKETIERVQKLFTADLLRADKSTMAHGLEARVPFLDHRLVEFTMSIPPEIKIPDKKSTKIILKKAVESILPNEIIYRKKQGFAAPVNEWMRNQWYDYTYNEIMNSHFVKDRIFDKNHIEKMFQLHKSGRKNIGAQLFSLLMLSLWHKKFFK